LASGRLAPGEQPALAGEGTTPLRRTRTGAARSGPGFKKSLLILPVCSIHLRLLMRPLMNQQEPALCSISELIWDQSASSIAYVGTLLKVSRHPTTQTDNLRPLADNGLRKTPDLSYLDLSLPDEDTSGISHERGRPCRRPPEQESFVSCDCRQAYPTRQQTQYT
jgi:hypothetical protein